MIREIVRVFGEDSAHFLNSLITQKCSGESAIYAHFLNPKGRTLFDSFIYPETAFSGADKRPSLLIDTSNASLLINHLEKYKLNSKVSVEMTKLVCKPTNEEADSVNIFKDLRHTEMPNRRIVKDRIESSGGDVSIEDYNRRRIMLAIAEGEEIGHGLYVPLELNLDLINGLSLKKGCYIGQELITRTIHRGVIRKRILPFKLKPSQSVSAGFKLGIEGNDGVVITTQGDLGLAIVRLENKDKIHAADDLLEFMVPDYCKSVVEQK